VQILATLRQPSAGQLERRVLPEIIHVVSIGVAAGNGEDTATQNVGHCVGDQGLVTMVGNNRGQHVDQAKPLVGTGQQQNAALGTDQPTIESSGDLLLADTWQREREKGIVGPGGRVSTRRRHGRFCPEIESGIGTRSLCDSSCLYHAHSRIAAMR
jgi:hypothetical protein